MSSYIYVKKVRVLGSNAAFGEKRYLPGEIVHCLQTEPGHMNVRGETARVFAVRNASDLQVVRGATISGVNHDRNLGAASQVLERIDQSFFDWQTSAAAAR